MKSYITTLFLILSITISAQFTVKGKIVDNKNNPLPFVNVFIKKASVGTTTDENGRFSFICNKRNGLLEISSVGFITQKFKVNKRSKPLNIILKEGTDLLEEVLIVAKPKKRLKKKENPAYRILKELWKRKQKIGLSLSETYQYKKHTTSEFGLNNIDSAFIKTLFKNEYKEIIKNVKYDNDGINYYLPLYIKEKVSRVYGNNKLNKERIDIEAERNKGMQANGFVFDRLANTFRDFNIFDNNIAFLKKSFISPLSSNGFATYDYVLYDSIQKNNKKLYNIFFFPRRTGAFAFQGNVWITDKDYAVKKIRMSINKNAGLNFIRNMTLEKEFKIKNDSIYLVTKNRYEGDFTIFDKNDNNKGLSIRQTDIFEKYDLTTKHSDDFYAEIKKKIRPNQYKKEKKYWDNKENKNDLNTFKLIERVKNKSQVKSLSTVINFVSSGFVKINKLPIQIGSLWSALSFNDVEGTRIKLSSRSFNTKDDRIRIGGHIAYGTKDKKFKYGIEGNYLISYEPRIAIAVNHRNDAEQLGKGGIDNSAISEKILGSKPLITRGTNYFLSKINNTSTNIDYAITKNFRFGLNIARAKITSATTADKFNINYLDQNNKIKNEVIDFSSNFYIAYTPNRRVYGLGVKQRFGKELFPSLLLNIKRGHKNIFGGTHDYNRLQLLYNQPLLLGQFGISTANIQLSKIFGTVPLTLLNSVPANQAYVLIKNTFSLMNYYDYVTDSYASLHYEHHFNGFILNRIPLINKLKLRSLVTFRTIYGTISKENKEINKSNITYNSPDKNPYYEYSVGLENIGYGNFKFLRVDAIWRTPHYKNLNRLAKAPPRFTIRVGISASL